MVLGGRPEQLVQWRCPEKRSQALRGRNLTRDIRGDGAPKVHRAPDGDTHPGLFCFRTIGHRRYTLKNPAAKPRLRWRPLVPFGLAEEVDTLLSWRV